MPSQMLSDSFLAKLKRSLNFQIISHARSQTKRLAVYFFRLNSGRILPKNDRMKRVMTNATNEGFLCSRGTLRDVNLLVVFDVARIGT